MKHNNLYILPKINIKKLWGNNESKEENESNIYISFSQPDPFTLLFTIKCVIFDTEKTNNLINENDFNALYSIEKIKNIDIIQYIKEMYDKFHNKPIKLGTNTQIALLKDAYANNEISNLYDGKQCKKYLQSIDMDTVIINQTISYQYGHGLYNNKPLTDLDMQKMIWLIEQPNTILKERK